MDKHSSDSFVWSGSLHWLHWILHCSFHLCDTVNPSAALCQEPQETVRVFEHAVTGRVWHVFPLQYSKRSKPSGVSLDLTMLPRWDDYRKLRKHYMELMMLMLNFSGETMLVGLSSMPRAQSEMLTCVKACPGSSCVHFKAAPEYVRWFRSKLIQFWDTLWLTSPEAVKLPFCLGFPQHFPRLERFFHAFRLRFSCCWDPFLAFRVRFRSSRTWTPHSKRAEDLMWQHPVILWWRCMCKKRP